MGPERAFRELHCLLGEVQRPEAKAPLPEMWNVSNFSVHLDPYRLVCGTCSNNSWYAPGYTDQKVRMCDPCYK